jgi:hypothetical protein
VDGVPHCTSRNGLRCPRDGAYRALDACRQARPLPYANFPHASTPPRAGGGHSRGYMIFTFPPDSAAVYYFIALVADACHFVRLGCFPKATTLLAPIAALSIAARIVVSTLTDEEKEA